VIGDLDLDEYLETLTKEVGGFSLTLDFHISRKQKRGELARAVM